MSTPAPNIFDTLAQQDVQRTQHDQTVAQPSQPNIFDHIAANGGIAPQPGQEPKGPTMGPQPKSSDITPDVENAIAPQDPFARIGFKVAAPFARKAMDAVDKLREVENFTQEGAKEHPVQAFMGHIANRLEGFLFGNETHLEDAIGGGKFGILTNPISASLIPGAEGEPAAAAMMRGGANFLKEGKDPISVLGTKFSKGIQELREGESIAQAPAKAAIRSTVGAKDDEALLSGNKTIVDEHLKDIASKEKAAYQKMDEAAGFDVKAERETLENDQYKLKQLGNTEADQNAREKLTTSIADSQKRIADAERKMTAAGVDTKEADTLHKQRMAGQDFKKMLVQQVSADGESVNVDGLLNASKKLRFSKFGDRLEQWLGKDGAEQYMKELQDAQDAGIHALRTRALGKTALKGLAGIGATGTGTAAIVHALSKRE